MQDRWRRSWQKRFESRLSEVECVNCFGPRGNPIDLKRPICRGYFTMCRNERIEDETDDEDICVGVFPLIQYYSCLTNTLIVWKPTFMWLTKSLTWRNKSPLICWTFLSLRVFQLVGFESHGIHVWDIYSHLSLLYKILSRWWFPRFFMFTSFWGRFPVWLIFLKGVETTN